MAELAGDMVTILGEPLPVVLPSADWQISERQRWIYGRIVATWHTVEGPHVVHREGRYYCFYSGGNFTDASYGIACAVADHPLGPWHDLGSSGPNVLPGTPVHARARP